MDYIPSRKFANRTTEMDPEAQFKGYLNRSRDKLTKTTHDEPRGMSLEQEL
jgi:hypothetical protein